MTSNTTSKANNSYLENNPTMNDDYLFAASACDCTGLAPTVAHNEAEAESYNEIAHYLPPIPSVPPAEGIHAEVNTLDKDSSSKKGLEGNHIL